MKYCCTDFEINTVQADVVLGCFEHQDDGTWDITVGPPKYVITGIKFCPFCGQGLRFLIIKAEDIEPYWVYDGTKTVGLFESREAAEAYVLLH